MEHAQVKRKLRRIVLMGGAMTSGNRSAVAEFNILTDPEAAQVRTYWSLRVSLYASFRLRLSF
jgi:inosine-uridine nucleoside N-ribohydrolase